VNRCYFGTPRGPLRRLNWTISALVAGRPLGWDLWAKKRDRGRSASISLSCYDRQMERCRHHWRPRRRFPAGQRFLRWAAGKSAASSCPKSPMIAPDLGQWGVEIVGKARLGPRRASGHQPAREYPQLITLRAAKPSPDALCHLGQVDNLSVDRLGFKFAYHAEFASTSLSTGGPTRPIVRPGAEPHPRQCFPSSTHESGVHPVDRLSGISQRASWLAAE